MVPCKQIIKKRSSGITDMRNSCRTWGNANPYFFHTPLHCIASFPYTQDMARLSKITRTIRRVSKVSLILFSIYLVFFLGTKIAAFIKNKYYPPPPPGPECKFGQLPQVDFPPQSIARLTYKINTISGTLPFFPNTVVVYKFKTRDQKLRDLQIARERLRNIGFAKNETKISNTLYQWQHTKIPNMFILYDITSYNFEIHSDYTKDNEVLSGINLPRDTSKLKLFILGELQKMGQDLSDIDDTKTSFTYLRIFRNSLVQVDTINEAQVVRIDLFQKPIENKTIYYPQPNRTNMYFLVGSGSSEKQPKIVEGYFTHLIADRNAVSTYPLKPTFTAYEQLLKGEAYIINEGGFTEIDISDLTLGYYLGSNTQEYLMPIFVFEGRGFKALVHASSICQ